MLGTASAIAGLIGLGLAIWALLPPPPPPDCNTTLPHLPGGTGWLLLGNYHRSENMYTRGPLYKVIASNYPNESDLPRLDEIIEVTAERSLIILDYWPGRSQDSIRSSPLNRATLDYDNSDTHIKILPGTCVEVRDIDLADIYDTSAAVWVRVGEPPRR